MRWLIALCLVSTFTLGCAKARHIAVVGDAAYAKAVFALDDAERLACQQRVLTEAQCAAIDPKIHQALVDVRAVTAALQATPANGQVPKNLPALLQDLSAVNAILAELSPGPVSHDLVVKGQAAIDAAIAFLNKIAGA